MADGFVLARSALCADDVNVCVCVYVSGMWRNPRDSWHHRATANRPLKSRAVAVWQYPPRTVRGRTVSLALGSRSRDALSI